MLETKWMNGHEWLINVPAEDYWKYRDFYDKHGKTPMDSKDRIIELVFPSWILISIALGSLILNAILIYLLLTL